MAENNDLEKIINKTKVGETITLVEKEENTYVRTKTGLRRISSKPISAERLNKVHHQYQ